MVWPIMESGYVRRDARASQRRPWSSRYLERVVGEKSRFHKLGGSKHFLFDALPLWGLLWGPKIQFRQSRHSSNKAARTTKVTEQNGLQGFLSSVQQLS